MALFIGSLTPFLNHMVIKTSFNNSSQGKYFILLLLLL